MRDPAPFGLCRFGNLEILLKADSTWGGSHQKLRMRQERTVSTRLIRGERWFRLIVWLALSFFLLWMHPLAAERGFSITNWTTKDGLPQDSVRALIQTSDRYLWVATPNGLARFDGSRFVVLEAATTENLPNNLVSAMCEDDRGTLWFGLESGELARYKDHEFSVVSEVDGWPSTTVDRIVDCGNGRILALSHNGQIMEVVDGAATRLYVAKEGRQYGDVVKDRDGPVWVLEGEEILLFDDHSMKTEVKVPPPPDLPAIMFPARKGGLWILDRNHLRRWRDGKWVEDRGSSPPLQSLFPIVKECADGAIIAGSFRQGVYIISPDGDTSQITKEDGLRSDWINCVASDDEGGMWVGTSGGGLARISDELFTSQCDFGDIESCSILSVSGGSQGELWLGTQGEGVIMWDGATWRRWKTEDGLERETVRSILCDRDGRVWAGTWGGGVYELAGERFRPAMGWTRHLDDVMCLYQADDGVIYAGTRVGLLKRVDEAWEFVQTQDGDLYGDIRSLAVDRRGALWVGTAGGGIGCLEDGYLIKYGRSEGLRTDNVWSIQPDLDDVNIVWAGTQGGGLSLIQNGKVETFTKSDGIPGNTISGMTDDGQGRLWLATEEGVACIRKSDVWAFVSGSNSMIYSKVFDSSDGLVSHNFSSGTQPTVCARGDGSLWFATSLGVAGLDLGKALAKSVPPPPPVIAEKLLVNDQVWRIPPGGEEITLPAGTQRLELGYGAVSFSSPKRIRYAYRLRGLEESWVSADTRRMVYYSHMPPGSYRFEVMASTENGHWEGAPTELKLRIEPNFWQIPWVQRVGVAALVVAVIVVTYFVARLRQKRNLAELRQQHLILKERERIARDIHDDLGANLTRISMLSDMTVSDPHLSEDTNSMVGSIAACARNSVTSLDEIVWAINPRHDTLEGLFDYLSHYCHDYLEETEISLILEIPDDFPKVGITSETRYGILMIVKEALNNVVKHAGPCSVRLAVTENQGTVSVLLEDDGLGFDSSGCRTESNGLASMEARVRKLSGRIERRSELGRGTRIFFEIPVTKAKSKLV